MFLQTAEGIVADTSEKRNLTVKVLLDPGSQRTYISEKIVRGLKLEPQSTQKITVNTFGSNHGKSSILNEYSFCLKSETRGCNLYMTGFAVPFICSPLTDQKVEVAEDIFPILKSLDIRNIGADHSNIDILVGADYYWGIVDGEIKRCGSDGLVAVNSKLGWLLSGPYNGYDSSAVNLASTHVMMIESRDEQDSSLNNQVERFWDLDTVGIKNNEASVYTEFLDNVKIVEGRYEVRMPFKHDHPLIEDNYALSVTRLKRLKCRLDKALDYLSNTMQ